MNKFKRALALCLALVMSMSLVACGGDKDKDKEANDTNQVVSETVDKDTTENTDEGEKPIEDTTDEKVPEEGTEQKPEGETTENSTESKDINVNNGELTEIASVNHTRFSMPTALYEDSMGMMEYLMVIFGAGLTEGSEMTEEDALKLLSKNTVMESNASFSFANMVDIKVLNVETTENVENVDVATLDVSAIENMIADSEENTADQSPMKVKEVISQTEDRLVASIAGKYEAADAVTGEPISIDANGYIVLVAKDGYLVNGVAISGNEADLEWMLATLESIEIDPTNAGMDDSAAMGDLFGDMEVTLDTEDIELGEGVELVEEPTESDLLDGVKTADDFTSDDFLPVA